MNKMKKLLSVLLVVCMVCAMSVGAFAADDATYSITISNTTNGYTYVAYQIFAGVLSEDGNTLSNITWGSDVDTTANGFSEALSAKYSTTDAAAIAEKITDETDAAAFAEVIAPYVTGGTTSSYSTDNSNYAITVSAAGYYLVVNTGVPSDAEGYEGASDYGYSDYILKVVADVTVTPKATSTPTFDKTVGTVDDNDLTNTDDATEDYAIGDSVPFTLTATLPDSYGAYTTFKLVFTDTLSDGLTYDAGSLKVTVDGTELSSSNYTLDVNGQNITVTINDLKTSASTAAAGSTVVVSYTATLGSDASSIESNTAKLSYSNNPNNSDSAGTTEEDKTYVVTFTVTVNKTDSSNNPLTGAGFTLYEYVGTEVEGADSNGYVAVGNEITGEDLTTFTFKGLAIGTYKLVETTTPDGYNTADPVVFTITAAAVEDATNSAGVNVSITSPTETDGFTISAETLTTTVINNAGSELPSTGGIGTTIFYIVGGVLVLGAAVLLITRKRMGKAE